MSSKKNILQKSYAIHSMALFFLIIMTNYAIIKEVS